jgi:hypothetical protein
VLEGVCHYNRVAERYVVDADENLASSVKFELPVEQRRTLAMGIEAAGIRTLVLGILAGAASLVLLFFGTLNVRSADTFGWTRP